MNYITKLVMKTEHQTKINNPNFHHVADQIHQQLIGMVSNVRNSGGVGEEIPHKLCNTIG